MRIFFKIILFPLTLALTLVILFCRFFCMASSVVLALVAGLLFFLGILVLFTGEWTGFLGFAVLAWIVSPYGLPLLAEWLTDRLDDLNGLIKSI